MKGVPPHTALPSSSFQADQGHHPTAPEVAEPQGRVLETF